MKHPFVIFLLFCTLHSVILSHFNETHSKKTPYYNTCYAPVPLSASPHSSFDSGTTTTHRHKQSLPQSISWNTAEFAHYFAQHNFTEHDILSQHMLYEFDAFIAFVKTIPGYKSHIEKLHRRIQHMNAFQKLTRSLQGKHYYGFTQRVEQLYQDIRREKLIHHTKHINNNCSQTVEQSIINILHTSSHQHIVGDKLDIVLQHLYDNAIKHNISLDTDIETCLDTALDTIKNTDNPHQFIFNTALVHHVACDIEERITQQKNDSSTVPKRNGDLLVRALEQFITRLNPITQIKGICENLVHTAHFVADMTLGKLYLTPEEYQLRKNSIWSTFRGLSKLKQLTDEQWVDIAAQCAADCVFPFGIFKVARYVKHIQRMCNANNRIATIAKRLKNAVDIGLTEKPVLVTTEGVIIRSTEKMQQAGVVAQEVISDSQILLESVQTGLLASVETESTSLNRVFDGVKGFGPCAHKCLKLDLYHIFGIGFDFKKDILNKIKGFHHDIMHAIQQKDIIKFTNTIIAPGGVYSADLVFGSSKPIYKTFFPAHWTRKEVVSSIHEAYNNFIKSGAKPAWGKDGKCRINSFIQNCIEIEMIITQTGKIITAYPKV